MPKKKNADKRKSRKKPANLSRVKEYRHDKTKRKNNPEAGLASYEKDRPEKKKYQYDPHLDPTLQWAGKAEHTSFEVDTVSLHIHERIATRAILRAVQREEVQHDMFADENLPLDKRIEFYQHDVDWSNRLILGDSLLVMNSLLVREGMAGKVQMIYVDPPYGIKYSSNFQPAINQREVKDDDKSLTREPEQIKAYRDTWRLEIHSYLTYLRDRIGLCKDLLHISGSIFVQINDDNLHLVKTILDEIFGRTNFVNVIPFQKRASYLSRFGKGLFELFDYIIWYAKDKGEMIVNPLYKESSKEERLKSEFRYYEGKEGIRNITQDDITNPNLDLSKVFRTHSASQKSKDPKFTESIIVEGKTLTPPLGHEWKANPAGMKRLLQINRLTGSSITRPYKIYYTDFPYSILNNLWNDTLAEQTPVYAVQTDELPIQRCILLTTHPGDLVFDPTCGGGTTAYVAEQWGRRWITCDTSRVALALARQRLMTASFRYYELAHPELGVSGGFIYETVPHITLESIANNPDLDPERVKGKSKQEIDEIVRRNAPQEVLYDKPKIDKTKVRVSGPFTVEAIPIPVMVDPGESLIPQFEEEGRISNRAGDYLSDMIELLRKDAITFPGGKKMILQNLRPLNVGFLHAEGEAKNGDKSQRVAVSFGPQYGPITAKQVAEAIPTAKNNNYDTLIFAGFSFDPEAHAFLQKAPVKGLTVHFANTSPDVLIGDLLKTTRGSQLFTVFGQPDVRVDRQKEGDWIVTLRGVDIYDPNTGEVLHSRGEDVAAWFLDTDYDGYCFHICQAFFPNGTKDPWDRLSRALRGIVDPEKMDALRTTVSLPFKPGENNRIAVKVIDYRGNEVIRVTELVEDKPKGRAK